jgi:type IV secretion system protein VirD4
MRNSNYFRASPQNTRKLKQAILPNLPYAFLFWLFSKIGEAYRLAPGRDVLHKAMAVVGQLNGVMSRPLPSFDPFDILFGLVGAAAVYGFVLYKKHHRKKWRKDVEYGSARWGTKDDIEPYTDANPDNNIILTASEGLTLNGRPKNPKHARNKNVLVIGGSGSGKTRFFVKPNLMQMHSSFVCTDPKGQILVEVGKLLKRGAPKMRTKIGKGGKPLKDRHGNVITEVVRKNGKIVYEPYEIKVLNTIDFKKSMHYNPFAYIKSEKDILKFVTALISNTKGEDTKGGEDFWVKAETLLYCALVGLIHYESAEDERNMNTLVELINSMEVHEEDESFQNPVDIIFERLEKGIPELNENGEPVADTSGKAVFIRPPRPDHFAVRQYKKYRLAAGKTAKSILISCGARLAPFDIAELRELVSFDEMELDTLGDRKTALFIIISDTDTTFNFVAALMYSQLFNMLCDKADNVYSGRLPVHVRFLLDEFANIGTIPNFDKLIATIRSREISACIILQAQSQLKNMYKDNAETIIGNCDTALFLGGKEKTTLKDLSESLGKETIDLLNASVTKGNSPSFGQNYQKLGKELMSIDELSVMDGSKCILQLRGVRPFLSDKYDITQHKNYRYLSDFDERNAFNMRRFVTRELKVKDSDEFDAYDCGVADEDVPQEVFSDFRGEQAEITAADAEDEPDNENEFDPTDTELF